MIPFFTSNPSDYTTLEQLYITEIAPPAQVQGVSFSGVGIAGEALRGPVNKPVLIGSEARFLEVFGGRSRNADGTGTLVNKLWLALLNKPWGPITVVRAAAAAAVAATKTFSDVVPTVIIRVDAANVGAWGNDITIDIANATDGNANHFNLVVHYQNKTVTYPNINTFTNTDDNTASVVGSDDGNLIVITKIANGRPLNATGTALLTGSDGSIADSDFTATGGPMETLAQAPGLGMVWLAERSSAALKTKWATLAAASSDRMFLICPDSSAVSSATAITDAASNKSDRLVYCFNHPYTLDPITALPVVVDPTSWMASILSQNGVEQNPIREESKKQTAGITKLTNEAYQRADYAAFKAAGMAALVKDGGFRFASGCTTLAADGSGKEQITARRQKDFINLSLANLLKYTVGQVNDPITLDAYFGAINSFMGDLKAQRRIVKDFKADDPTTANELAAGIQKFRVRCQLMSHILFPVLLTQTGDTVTITN